MPQQTKHFYEFGRFRIDTEDRLLLKDGEVVQLAPKVFDILLVLVEKGGRVLDKDELMQKVWADTFVEEGNLARNVSTLRKALGESEEGRQYIETIPRRGYRFVASVKEISADMVLVRESSRLTIEQEETLETPDDPTTQSDAQRNALQAQTAEQVLKLVPETAQSVTQWVVPETQTLAALQTARAVGQQTKAKFKLWWLVFGLLVVAALISIFYLGRITAHAPLPTFHQLTFRRGYVWSARFASDEQTIIYSARWEDKPSELFTTRPETPESRPLGLADMGVLAISKTGEMAVLLKPSIGFSVRGTLARMPLTGGAPREVLNNVQSADFSPDGKELAVSHWESTTLRIEYPIGKTLYEAKPPEWLSSVRVSPKGDRIAFLDYTAARFDDRGAVAILDLEGNKKIISREYTSAYGLAWSATGDEIFFAASEDDLNNSIRAVTLSGKERVITRAAGRLLLHDVSPAGKVLATREDGRIGIVALPPTETREKELSWLDGSWLRDLSVDGKTILFDEEQTGGGATGAVYIRKTDGSPAVRLGEGHAVALSPDGKWALAHLRYSKPRRIVLYPTGAGEARVLISDATNYREQGYWFPDSKHVLLFAKEPDHESRLYIQDIDGGEPRAILQEGLNGKLISPDGKFILAGNRQKKTAIYPVEGGEPIPLVGLAGGDNIVGWSTDGASIYIAQGSMPVTLYKLNYKTGQKELLKEIFAPNIAGLFDINGLFVTPDGKSYAYTYSNTLSDLFIIDGGK